MITKRNLFYSCLCLGLQVYYSVLYRWRVFGKENLPQEGGLIASNHASYYDPPFIGASAWPTEVHFLADNYLFDHYLFATLIKNLNAYPIHRSVKDTSTIKNIAQFLKDGEKILIFPEGRRAQTDKLQPFKLGLARLAIRTKCLIVPTYIRGTLDVWPASRRFPRFGQNLTCVFGKPIHVDRYLSMDKKEAFLSLTQDVYEAIENLRLWLDEHDRTKNDKRR